MNHVLILCRSITQAQRVSRGLTAAGISNHILRSPLGLTKRGCSYSVKIAYKNISAAVETLQKLNIQQLRFFLLNTDGIYAEVTVE